MNSNRNKPMAWVISFLVPFTLACHAQKNDDLPLAPNQHSLLWKVSGKGLAAPSYVLGTMHILCPADARISPQLQAVISRVSVVYFELNLSDMGQMFAGIKAMGMQGDTTLQDLLGEAEFQKVAQYFDGRSALPFKVLQRFKPLLLSALVAEQQMPCESTNGMEMAIMEQANKLKKEIQGLETMAFQASLFDNIPYAMQAQELLKAIDSVGASHAEVSKMLDAYRRQDLEALERLTLEEGGELAGQMDALLYNRNLNWVQQFDTIATKGSLLIAVGAGHLPGEKGVLELLRRKGYTVEPLLNTVAENKTSHR